MADVVTFQVPPAGPYRVIEIDTGGDNEIDWLEIYSEWKVWAAASDNLKHPPAFRTVGGDPISDVKNLGSTFFLMWPWRFKPAEHSHRLRLAGNIFTDPAGESPVVETDGSYTVIVEYEVSTLVESAVARLDLAQLQETIYLDTVSGDDDNDGTPTAPVQTIGRAFELAIENNLQAIDVFGDVVMDRTVTGWRFRGTNGPATASIDFNGYKLDCKFDEVEMTGDADGSHVRATSCKITSLASASGEFSECGLTSLFTPGGGTKTSLVRCYSDVPGSVVPQIDLADSLSDDLQMRAYSGGVRLLNVDVADQQVSVEFVAGHLILDATCTDGYVSVRGVGTLTDYSGPGLTLDTAGFVAGSVTERINDLHAVQVRDASEERAGSVRTYTFDGGRQHVLDDAAGTRTGTGMEP